jgi:hypothetical protein
VRRTPFEKGPGDRHLARQFGIFGIEFDRLNDPLAGNQFDETALKTVRIFGCLAGHAMLGFIVKRHLLVVNPDAPAADDGRRSWVFASRALLPFRSA